MKREELFGMSFCLGVFLTLSSFVGCFMSGEEYCDGTPRTARRCREWASEWVTTNPELEFWSWLVFVFGIFLIVVALYFAVPPWEGKKHD